MRTLIEVLTVIALILATTYVGLNNKAEKNKQHKTLNQLHDLRGE